MRVRYIRREEGFTLQELLVVIAIMGILFAIAMMVWNNIMEARRVDAAANQLAADMRLAHSRATNQLTDWRVEVAVGSPDYELQRLDGVDGAVADTTSKSLPEGTKIKSATFAPSHDYMEFNSDGTMAAPSGPSGSVVVSAEDGDPEQKITFISATSRVEID